LGRISVSQATHRLAAIFYTRASNRPISADRIPADAPMVFFDGWPTGLFKPNHQDKPSPHASLDRWYNEIEQTEALFRLPRYHVYKELPNTNSMEPIIDTNTIIILEALTPRVLRQQPLQSGDIVTWLDDAADYGVLHRVLGVKPNNQFYIKGDNCVYPDHINGRPEIPGDYIIDRVVGLIYTRQEREHD
jgi:hypothetical protein